MRARNGRRRYKWLQQFASPGGPSECRGAKLEPQASSLGGANDILAHPGTQGLGNDDGSIRLLIVFQDGHHRARHGDGCAVERVDRTRVPFWPGTLPRMFSRRAWKSVQLEVLVTSP